MPVTIVPAADIAFDDYLKTFNQAYSDYFVPLQMEAVPMRRLIQRDAVDMSASKVALDDGKPVGVGMLAIHKSMGWIGGLGIIPSHRRRGIGRALTRALLDTAQNRGLKQVKLEVIEENAPARKLYHELGFENVRRLLILEHDPDTAPTDSATENSTDVAETPAHAALGHFRRLHTTSNPWQRRYEALSILASQMTGWTVTRDNETAAYAVGWALPDVIRFMDIAGAADAIRPLLGAIHQQYVKATASIINMPEDDPISAIMQEMGYRTINSQFEMQITFS